MKLLGLLCLAVIRHVCFAINIDDINLSNCTIGSDCEDSTIDTITSAQSTVDSTEKTRLKESSSFATVTNVNTDYATDRTEQESILTTSISITSTTARSSDEKRKIGFVARNNSDVCACDIKISSCDINCCCDIDCNEYQLTVFSNCENHRSKMYDSRYCYTKNFIQRNNTQFILDRIASNLFCIAYDNLPPIYGMSEVPTLRNRQDFEVAKYSINPKRYTWDWHGTSIPSGFNFSSHYHDKTSLWKFHDNFVKLMELPQSGLTGRCTFGKIIKYLETSGWSCMQTDLSNNNSYLFAKNYNGFAVISSPHLFNSSYATSANNSCPSNVCLTPRSFYCAKNFTSCVSKKILEQTCTASGKCQNAMKHLRYTIFHNGTNGIKFIEARFVLANITEKFYQHFEIIHEWIEPEEKIEKILRSGNPGYKFEKSIIIGKLESNIGSQLTSSDYVKIDASNYYLTLPLRGKNGFCMDHERYRIGFGENLRIRCSTMVRMKNFSTSMDCKNLQNQTLRRMLDYTFDDDSTKIEDYKIFVSKIGDSSRNDDTSMWTKILLENIPRNVVTGQLVNDKIRCSALVTSMNIEILYTILPNNEDNESYKIAGVAINFSEPMDIEWNKCVEKNCTDIISIELESLVTFTDISTSSMYYYAGGPNLDISLPYDFFYPFMSNASYYESFGLLIVIALIVAQFF